MKIASGISIFFFLSVQICNAQEYHGDYWDFFSFHEPSTSAEGTGKIYLNSNNDAFSSLYNPSIPSCSDKLRISYSTSQNASLFRDDFNALFHENAFYNAFGIDVPVKELGTFSIVRNYNHIITFSEDYGEYESKYTSYNINYSRDIFNGFHAGAGLNYFKWDGMFPSNFTPDKFFSEYYSLNFGISYNYSLPGSEYYCQSAFIDMSVLNVLTSHPNTKNDFGPWNLPQIDHISLGYISKYKGFGILKGVDDFQIDVQIEEVDLLNSYYYNTVSIGAEIKFIDIVALKVGNYFFIEDYTTFGLGLSFPLKLVSEIPLMIGVDYSHLKAPLYYNQGNNVINSFSANLRYDLL
jgi:hypothetical protein